MAPMKAPTSTLGFIRFTWKAFMKSGMVAWAAEMTSPFRLVSVMLERSIAIFTSSI